jgi:hypothetical protein
MKRALLRSAVAVVAVYCTAWAATAIFGRTLLEHYLWQDLQTEWRASRADAEREKERFPGQRDRIAFPDGPSLQVKACSCRGALVVYAEIDRTIGGLNGRGTIGRYLVTPWRVYILSERRTWVS